ncbi:pyridoxamine 5'-phosphate oxidase family protein [Streptomyces sp. CHD11]|uniref:pyridoxamine 5'-phosphate oxidase family protein n=1 Tax=Streptomyces sp. CHD11 TaxID=2741325 RepID=UPI001BFC6AD6|nr:pyridoxamine 5'-phosphate oxidase family protein [Streptomyces sp. CHD11]MBT3150885.1 pyridoxamine 5'-phosphate oxidase family protein [Streptomyces sp. CHD11]
MSATPESRLDPRYSDPEAGSPPWSEVERLISEAELFWISTVRPDGRPHVTPLPAVWSAGALHFCTGPDERKARNLAENPQVVLTTGTNTWNEGYDVVVEGAAVRIADDARLRELAAAWEEKYGSFWHFEVRDGHFRHGPGRAVVFSVAPRTVFGFGKGEPFSQSRWRFA